MNKERSQKLEGESKKNPRKLSLKTRILLLSLKTGLGCSALIIGAHYISRGWQIVEHEFTTHAEAAQVELTKRFATERVIREVVQAEEIPVEELIEAISAEFGINSVITKAMAIQESGGWERTDRVRFEQHLHGRFKTPAGLNEIERQFYASSFGLLQIVYGFHKEFCELRSYSELLEPASNLRCGLSILKRNLESAQGKTRSARLRTALRMYNGSGPQAEHYADTVMQRIGEMLLDQLGEV